jgi:hypothetical protein
MTTCETITLCPDLEVESEPVLSEPIEVGPFREGQLFVKLRDVDPNAGVDISVGISPTGYENWERQWVDHDTVTGVDEERMYSVPLTNFGNWLRLKLTPRGESDETAVVQAWFVGK